MNLPYTVDIVGDEMVVLDEDGNDCDRYRLVGLHSAKRQLRRWQNDCTFDYAKRWRRWRSSSVRHPWRNCET